MEENIIGAIVILVLILIIASVLISGITITTINSYQGIQKCISGGQKPNDCYCGFNNCK